MDERDSKVGVADSSRRRFVGACASALAAGLAGCSLAPADADSDSDTATEPGSGPDPGPSDGSGGSKPEGNATGTADGSNISPDALEKLDQSTGSNYHAVYEETIDSVVQIRVYSGGGVPAQGSGMLYDDEGHVLTNQHVVRDAGNIYLRFTSGGWKRARVAGTDVYSDLAVLTVDETPASATPLSFVRTDPPIGAKVVAIGNPFGYSGSLSAGIVSGVNRTLPAANGFSIPDAIQTDAAVNPGNSGGPLVLMDGDVAGIINSGRGDNVGFAISGPLVRRVAPALISSGSYDHSYMGVRIRGLGPLVAAANGIESGRGVYVDEVIDGSPSDGVLQGSTGTETVNGTEVPSGGDVIVGMDDTSIPTTQALSSFLALETSPGETIAVDVRRDGSRTTVDLTLGERPEP